MRITKCNPNDVDMARSSHGLTHGGILSRLVSPERATTRKRDIDRIDTNDTPGK